MKKNEVEMKEGVRKKRDFSDRGTLKEREREREKERKEERGRERRVVMGL